MSKKKKTSVYSVRRDFFNGDIVFCHEENHFVRIKTTPLVEGNDGIKMSKDVSQREPIKCRSCKYRKCCYRKSAITDGIAIPPIFVWSPASRTMESKSIIKQIIKYGTAGKDGRSNRGTQRRSVPRNK